MKTCRFYEGVSENNETGTVSSFTTKCTVYLNLYNNNNKTKMLCQ